MDEDKKLDFQKQLDAEVSKRLTEMEDPAYEFPERMKRADWIVAAIIMAAALVIVEFATLTAGAGMM